MTKSKKAPWEECTRCSKIPSSVSEDFLHPSEGPGITKEIRELPGMKDEDFSSGMRTWTTICELCGTEYEFTTDVEPFLWDVVMYRMTPQKIAARQAEAENKKKRWVPWHLRGL